MLVQHSCGTNLTLGGIGQIHLLSTVKHLINHALNIVQNTVEYTNHPIYC